MALPDESWRIDTPENIAFDYEVAGIGSRLLAAIVDSVLIVILQVIVYVTLALLIGAILGRMGLADSAVESWLLAIFGLVAFAFFWGYYVLFELLWNGQTPGKRWVGLRVIRADGTPITLSESLVRNLVRLVDFMPAFYGIGMVTMFVNAQARRLGDFAAGTMVVHDKPTVTLASLMVQLGPFPPPAAASMDLPVERLSSREIQIAEDFLRRRGGFASDLELAQQIALLLLRKMDLLESWGVESHPVNIINDVVHAWRTRGTNR